MSDGERGKRTILVVEDESALRRLMRKMLEKQGFAVLEASTPGEALELGDVQSESVDLMITDLMMPEMSGSDLATEMATRHPHLRVLFMSGYARADIEQQGLLDPGMPFLPKPFNIARLTESIQSLLGPVEAEAEA